MSKIYIYCPQEAEHIGTLPNVPGLIDFKAVLRFEPKTPAYSLSNQKIQNQAQVLCPRCGGALHIVNGDDHYLFVPGNLEIT